MIDQGAKALTKVSDETLLELLLHRGQGFGYHKVKAEAIRREMRVATPGGEGRIVGFEDGDVVVKFKRTSCAKVQAKDTKGVTDG